MKMNKNIGINALSSSKRFDLSVMISEYEKYYIEG